MKLFYKSGTCALAPHIVAREAGVPLELVAVDLATKKLEDGSDYFAINPNGYVPALDIGEDSVLTEASVCVQYLADQKPESGLMPKAGEPERYRAQQWLAFISTELHKPFGSLFNPSAPEAAKEQTHQHLAKRLAFVDKALDGKTHLMGDTFTAPDAYAFTVLSWAPHVGVDLSPYANVVKLQGTIGQRPAVQQALREQGLA